jgi:excisionase family DNA binding protein
MLAQSTLLVVSPNRTSRKAATRTRDILKSRDDIRIIGIALNRTSLGRYAYPYYYKSAELPRETAATSLMQRLGAALSSVPLLGQPSDPDLISIRQAAQLLGVRTNTIKRWCEDGRLPAVKKGFKWWIRRDELQTTLLDRLMKSADLDLATAENSDGRTVAGGPEMVKARGAVDGVTSVTVEAASDHAE